MSQSKNKTGKILNDFEITIVQNGKLFTDTLGGTFQIWEGNISMYIFFDKKPNKLFENASKTCCSNKLGILADPVSLRVKFDGAPEGEYLLTIDANRTSFFGGSKHIQVDIKSGSQITWDLYRSDGPHQENQRILEEYHHRRETVAAGIKTFQKYVKKERYVKARKSYAVLMDLPFYLPKECTKISKAWQAMPIDERPLILYEESQNSPGGKVGELFSEKYGVSLYGITFPLFFQELQAEFVDDNNLYKGEENFENGLKCCFIQQLFDYTFNKFVDKASLGLVLKFIEELTHRYIKNTPEKPDERSEWMVSYRYRTKMRFVQYLIEFTVTLLQRNGESIDAFVNQILQYFAGQPSFFATNGRWTIDMPCINCDNGPSQSQKIFPRPANSNFRPVIK